jgi:peptide/nickel transport system permease protein
VIGSFIIKRLYYGLFVIIGVTIFVFIVTRVIGDPVGAMLPLEASAAQRAAFSERLGFNRPLTEQFWDFARGVTHLDLGESLWQHRPVTQIVMERLPMTIYLVSVSMVLAITLSLVFGVWAAIKPDGLVDRATVLLSLFGLSVPQFWLALLLIMLFSVDLRWLPTSGSGTPAHLVMPALSLALPAIARMVMVVRSSVIDELNAHYINMAIAKGIPFRRVVGVHALRNVAIPMMALAGWEVIRALAGYSVVVETVFGWPGLGLAASQAISQLDLFLLQGIVFYVAIIVVALNIVLDVAQKLADPRIELS